MRPRWDEPTLVIHSTLNNALASKILFIPPPASSAGWNTITVPCERKKNYIFGNNRH